MNFQTFKTKIKELGFWVGTVFYKCVAPTELEFWVGNCFLQICRSYGAFQHQPINSQPSTFNLQLSTLKISLLRSWDFLQEIVLYKDVAPTELFRFNLQPSTFNS
jgi:hypothetical protein